jgi:hypothetical protein
VARNAPAPSSFSYRFPIKSNNHGEKIMKTIASALLALSVLAGIASAPASADSRTFWQQQDENRGGSGP